MITEINMVSLMAGNADFFYRKLAGYLTARTGVRVRIADEPGWREREKMLDEGLAQIGFICGLQYIRKVDDERRSLEPFVAPVMRSPRYRGKPIYFSDVVVRRDSPFQSLNDLQGRLWACNEPTSHSGCNLVRYCLAVRGEGAEFFQEIVESGSHESSLAMLIDGQIDAAAIDSTVLELELRLRPELGQYIRVIETLGPSPIPPSVISAAVDPVVRRAIQQAMLMMHADAEGRSILDSLSIARFVRVSDSDYDQIRSMAEKAHRVSFALTPLTARREDRRLGAALER